MKLRACFAKAVLAMVFFPCLVWSASLTVTVKYADGTVIEGAMVAAINFSTSGPNAVVATSNAAGKAEFTLTDGVFYQVCATKLGHLPSVRDQMFNNWEQNFNASAGSTEKAIVLRRATSTDKARDIKASVKHGAERGKVLFLNVMNLGTYEPAGMGLFVSTDPATSDCYVYGLPTNEQDYPYQLDIFNPTSRKGDRISISNKAGSGENFVGSLNIAAGGNSMAPPKKQIESDEQLGNIAFEGIVTGDDGTTPIEGVSIMLNGNNGSTNLQAQTDENGYYSFYESADTNNKIFTAGREYNLNFMKQGRIGTFVHIQTYDPSQKVTHHITMASASGRIIGKVNIKVGSDLIPIPQAWINAWGDGRNYGPAGSDMWESSTSNRLQGMGNASGQVEKGIFALEGLPSGRYTLNVWSEFNNQPVVYNNGVDGLSGVDSFKWDTGGSNWGDDFIVEINTVTFGATASAKVYQAASPSSVVTSAMDSDGNIIINIVKTPDGTKEISGTVTFADTTATIDPSSILIVAREDWKTDGTMPKSGFTVLKVADKVSDYVYNFRISGLAAATYRVEIKAPGFGMKMDNSGPRTNENINLSSSDSATVNMKLAPAGYIEGVLRTPKGTIYIPKFDGPDNSNVNLCANGADSPGCACGQVGKDGKFRIEGLLPGKYELVAQGWGNSYTYATARLGSVIVEAGKITTVEIPLKKGVKIHPMATLPDAIQLSLVQGSQTQEPAARLTLVYTPASVSLSAQNIEQVFKMGKQNSQQVTNEINYWGGRFQDVSIEPGAYNFFLVYELNFPRNAKNYSKTIIGRAKNVVVDISKQTDQYSQDGSTNTWNMVTAQFIPVTVSAGSSNVSGSYAGINTIREADMEVIKENFDLFMTYVPRVTLIDSDGNILATGLCTPTPQEIEQSGVGENGQGPGDGTKDMMSTMSYDIPNLSPADNVKVVVTTPNYPPLVKTISIPGTMNINMDTDVGAGAKITGAVRNSAGTAIAGATVRIKGRLLDRSVKSQTDGSYLIPGLAAGTYRLLVTADGYALEADKLVVYNQDLTENFSLSACGGAIYGAVYSQKFPYPLTVSGARVVAYDDTANGLNPEKELAIYETATNNSGEYKISPLVEGHTYKVALVVPGKAVQIFSPSPEVGSVSGSSVTAVDFTYKSIPPRIKLVSRPSADGTSVTLEGESPKKLNSLTAKYNEGLTYDELTAVALTVSQVGQKGYSITLLDKAKSYAVRFTVDDGGSSKELDFIYNTNNKAQATENIDQQAVASGDVILDSQGNDTSGIYISPGSITLADNSLPEVTLEKEKREASPYTAAMDADDVGGDIYHVDLTMNGSQQNADKSMTLTLGYDQTLVGDKTENLSVYQYNETTAKWDPVIGATMVDPISGTVSIEVKSIENAAADSGSATAPRKLAQAQFNGKEFKVSSRLPASTSNQSGIFMVSKVPAGLSYPGNAIEITNVPNPFNLASKSVTLAKGGTVSQKTTEGTLIRFTVPTRLGTSVKTTFKIYNIAGELVRELNANDLVEGTIDGGFYYYIDWDGKNKNGNKCASGVYFCAAEIGTEKKVVKMALVK